MLGFTDIVVGVVDDGPTMVRGVHEGLEGGGVGDESLSDLGVSRRLGVGDGDECFDDGDDVQDGKEEVSFWPREVGFLSLSASSGGGVGKDEGGPMSDVCVDDGEYGEWMSGVGESRGGVALLVG